MTWAEFKALLKSGDKRTSGLAILWLDGYYSGRAGLGELPDRLDADGWPGHRGDLRDQRE
jgi:hypothetical protein